MEETTEGTPVVPGAATDFIAIQDGDFDMTPNFALLENKEQKNSIGSSKGIVGGEDPTISGAHYLRHSGTEGTAPNFGKILEGAFGAIDTEGTEYSCTSGSTVSSVAITSIGANGIRGQALLLKDGVNGYAIRPIHSTTTNACVPGFNLLNAPASGVKIGKPITYYPANTGHKSYSVWSYEGNGGAIQLETGVKWTDLSMDFSAGELINLKYSGSGLGFYFNPIQITSSTKYIDFTDDSGTFAAVLPVQWYKDPHDLAAAVKTAMDTANSAVTHTCTYSDTTGKYTILCTGTTLTLKWSTGTNTANTAATKLGFAVSDNSGTAATTGYTGGTAQSYAASYTPTYDTADPLAAKAHELFIGDSTNTTPVAASKVSFKLSNARAIIPSVSADTGRSGAIFTSRKVTFSATVLLDKYEAKRFYKYRTNEDTRVAYNFGIKSGGNWVPGKCGCLYLPTTTIQSWDLSPENGLVALTMELATYVDASANGECYLSFV